MRHSRSPVLPMLHLLVATAAAWTLPWAATSPRAHHEQAQRRYDDLLGSRPPELVVCRVYARAGKSCQAGRDANAQRVAIDPRPWCFIGSLAVDGASLDTAITSQRKLLEEEARQQHKALRVQRNLVFAWTTDDVLPSRLPTLGSYTCPSCGKNVVAGAAACGSCGAPRPDHAGDGELTLSRRANVPAGQSAAGFSSAQRDDRIGPRGGAVSMCALAAASPAATRLQCWCGATSLTIAPSSEPQSVSVCHCGTCRRLSGAPFLSSVMLASDAVEISSDAALIEQQTSKHVTRKRCSRCYAPVLATLGPQRVVVPAALFCREQLERDGWRPMHHLHYDARIMDVDDGLPKYRTHFGGERVDDVDD